MLLAVEGGGFFSSSATGYSKGLTLLILGRQEEKEKPPMRVSPWDHKNHYHLVDQEQPILPDLQLAPGGSDRLFGGCAAFFCFNNGASSAAGIGPPSPPPPPIPPSLSPPKAVLSSPSSDNGENQTGGRGGGEVYLKSSLKKTPPNGIVDDGVILPENEVETRRVQWTDACGKELAQIREFESSDESDDEFEDENERRCACTIM